MSAVGPKTGQLDLNIRQIRYHGSLAGTGKEEANCMEFYNAMRPRHKQCNLSLDDFEHSFWLKLGYKSLVQMFQIRYPANVSGKTDFPPVLKNTPTNLSCDGVFSLFQRKKNGILTGPKGQFKIPYTLQMVDLFEAFKKSSLQLKMMNFSNPSRWTTSLSRKILREIHKNCTTLK